MRYIDQSWDTFLLKDIFTPKRTLICLITFDENDLVTDCSLSW